MAFSEIILKQSRLKPQRMEWLASLSSSSYLDILIRELFLSTEPRVATTLAKNCVELNIRAKPLTHDPGDPGWDLNVKFYCHSRPEQAGAKGHGESDQLACGNSISWSPRIMVIRRKGDSWCKERR